MISETLSLWSNGAVTLPKEWREQFSTKHFIAEETPEGYLLIKPIVDVQYWEDDEGNFGLHFPMGIEAGELAKMMDQAQKNITKKKKIQKGK